MGKILLFLAGFFYFMGTVQAMMPITAETVQAAQQYGVSQKNVSTEELLTRWTVADRKQTNKFGSRERIVVYTPYVVAAVDAQSKTVNGQKVNVDSGLTLAKEYNDILALGVIIDSSFQVEPKYLKAYITQGRQVLMPYNVTLDKAVMRDLKVNRRTLMASDKFQTSVQEKTDLYKDKVELDQKTQEVLQEGSSANSPAEQVIIKIWNMQYFIYFDLVKLDLTKPMVLTISDQAGGVREFEINLVTMN